MFEIIKNIIKSYRESLLNAEEEYNDRVVFINEHVGNKDRAEEMKKASDKRNAVEEEWYSILEEVKKSMNDIKSRVEEFCMTPIPSEMESRLEAFLNTSDYSPMEISMIIGKCKSNYLASKRLFEKLSDPKHSEAMKGHSFTKVDDVVESIDFMEGQIKKAFSSRNPNTYTFVSLTYDSTWEDLNNEVSSFLESCAD